MKLWYNVYQYFLTKIYKRGVGFFRSSALNFTGVPEKIAVTINIALAQDFDF